MGTALMVRLVLLAAAGQIIATHDPPVLAQPLFFAMQEEFGQVAEAEEVLSFSGRDRPLEHQLELLSDEAGAPLLFYADVQTPVCIDGLCKPVHIAIYWNLLGAYVGYGLFEGEPLTKFDHDEFTEADQLKLHQLLLDKNSVLRRKKLSDLFSENAESEEKVKYKGVEVDAVSGATKKEIKNSVVEGALYSCYTLWHLVHGEVDDKIKEYLPGIYSDSLEHRFLYSDYEGYQLYALKQMDAQEFGGHASRLIALYRKGNPLTRTYLLKKLPDSLWGEAAFTSAFYGSFSSVDINTRTMLVEKLEHAGPGAALLLSEQLPAMSKNQLKAFLAFLSASGKGQSPEIRKNLAAISRSTDYAYSYLVGRFLESQNE